MGILQDIIILLNCQKWISIIVRETYFHYNIFMQVLAYMLYRPIDTRINMAWIS